MPNSVFVVVLAEDLQAFVFLRRVLIASGFQGRDIRPMIAPPGQQSGEQYVRERYPTEVTAHRQRGARRRSALVVHTDADTMTVAKRAQTLADVLQSQGESSRQAEEAIALLIPKRNIETWIEFGTQGSPVDESAVYAKLSGRESDCQSAAQALVEDAHQHAPRAQAPPSWQTAVAELQRLRPPGAQGGLRR